jgi:hypothetical protein
MITELFEKHLIVRRAVMIWMMVMTTLVMKWAVVFAVTSPRSGAEVAMILGAILTPWTTLQGFIFKFYNEARQALARNVE